MYIARSFSSWWDSPYSSCHLNFLSVPQPSTQLQSFHLCFISKISLTTHVPSKKDLIASWSSDPAKINSQTDSRLFDLPAELRNYIFDLAFTPDLLYSEDMTSRDGSIEGPTEQDFDELFRDEYRRGNICNHDPTHVSIPNALVQTCRLAHLEARLKPLQNVPHILTCVTARPKFALHGHVSKKALVRSNPTC